MTLSLLAIATLANGLLVGLIPTIVDGVKPSLKARLNLAENHTERFSQIFFFTWLPAMPLAGWLLDELHNRELLLYLGLLPLILGFAWLALAKSVTAVLSNALLLGVGYSMLATATIRLMTVAFFDPEYVREYHLNIAALNLGFVAVGVGSIIGPWIMRAMERWSGSRQGLLYLSLAMLAPAVLTALCERRLFPATAAASESWDGANSAHLTMIALIILIYFALDNCLDYWPAAYLKEIGYEGGGVAFGLHVFWISFVAARGAAAWWLYWHPTHGFVITLTLLAVSALILGNLAGGFEFGSGSIGYLLLGASYGPLLPGFLGIALDLFPKPLPMSVFGFLLALSGVDTLFMRPVIGALIRTHRARSVMFVPTILALIGAAILLVLQFIRN